MVGPQGIEPIGALPSVIKPTILQIADGERTHVGILLIVNYEVNA